VDRQPKPRFELRSISPYAYEVLNSVVMSNIRCVNVCCADSILPVVDVRVLHGGVRGVGVAGGALLPGVPAVGHARARRARLWCRRYRAARLLFLRHCHEHCCAYIAIRLRRGESFLHHNLDLMKNAVRIVSQHISKLI
jgi:hypothetical protein